MGGSGWSRTKSDIIGKNGEYVSGFDYEDIKNIDPPMMGKIGKDELWKNLKYFLDNVIPVAEENDVKLAIHPDDPPIENFRGIDRIMNSIESYDKLLYVLQIFHLNVLMTLLKMLFQRLCTYRIA